jgi:hypothetical protein
LAVAFLLPGGGSSDIAPTDEPCRCAIDGGLVEVTACGLNSPNPNNIDVIFSSDAHSGQCEGTAPPCPVAGHCGGGVQVTVMSNAFTAFVPIPNPGKLPPNGAVTETFWLTTCGETQSKRCSIIDNNVISPNYGVSLCLVDLAAWCSDCLDW